MRIQQSSLNSWQAPFELGAVQLSYAICRVVASRSAAFAKGDFVRTYTGCGGAAATRGDGGAAVARRFQRALTPSRRVANASWVDKAVVAASAATKLSVQAAIPLHEHIGALGMVGQTAYYGVEKVFAPIKVGETALVTGAAGAVGVYVCQLLKKRGCRVVGVAGSDAKCASLTSTFGCDVAINYKTTDVAAALAAHCPHGIDVFFDNVGGAAFDAAVKLMNVHGRIAICGSISQYDALDTPERGPSRRVSLAVCSLSVDICATLAVFFLVFFVLLSTYRISASVDLQTNQSENGQTTDKKKKKTLNNVRSRSQIEGILVRDMPAQMRLDHQVQ